MHAGRLRISLSSAAILVVAFASAQDAKTKVNPSAANPAPASAATTPEYEKQMAAWKQLIGQLRALQVRHKIVKPEEQKALEKEYDDLVAKGEELLPKVVHAAIDAYKAQPNQNEEVSRFLFYRADSDVKSDLYAEALEIARLLIQNNYPNPAINEIAGIAAFASNDYDAAEKYLSAAKEKKALDEQGQMYLDEVPKYREYWQKEQQLREAEAKANDLPRVLLKTTKGDIVLELFENEAPNTVANFISLVEKGFYNNLLFHRVIHGFMAQGGDPTGTGSGGPGYTIACECYQPNHRNHFAGSLSMAHAGKDTGGSQFFITFRPTPHLNGKHTVFGRVVEGMQVLEKLKQTEGRDEKEPDKILEAKVLRKREHEYKPATVAEK